LDAVSDEMKEDVTEIFNEERENIENLLKSENKRLEIAKETLEHLRSERDGILISIQVTQNSGNRALRVYRDEFTEVRGRAPSHFSEMLAYYTEVSDSRGQPGDKFSIQDARATVITIEGNRDANKIVYDTLISEFYDLEIDAHTSVDELVKNTYEEVGTRLDVGEEEFPRGLVTEAVITDEE
jgi:hypothetical protein